MAPSPSPGPAPPPPETDSIIDGFGGSNVEDDGGAVALPSFGNAEQNGDLGDSPDPPKEEKKPWDKPLTIPEMRKSSTNWSLASDSGEFSQRMIAKTSHLEKEVDGLVNTAKSTNTKVHNTFNDFLMLANTQFIENRVYDDYEDVDSAADKEEKNGKKEPQSKSREQREAEVIPRVIKALTLGVNVLDTAFEQLDANAGNSDSEEEDATYKSVDPILEPKDLYAHRALPYIIGTPAFMQDDDVGLADLYSDEEEGESATSGEEDESDLSESEYSDSASESGEESAPKKSSRTTSTAKSGASGDDRESDGDLFASEKDESDSEGSQSATSKPKTDAFTDELAARVGAGPPAGENGEQETKDRSVSEVSHGSSKHGKKDEKRKKKSKKKRSGSQAEKTEDDDNLFGSPEQEDDDSPFGKKGIFGNTGGGLFDDDGDGLFDEGPSKKNDPIYEDVTAEDTEQQKKGKASGLFDEENDLFGSSPPQKKEELTKSSKAAASADAGLFEDDDDLFGSTEKKPAKKDEKKKSVDLFGGDDEDDLFGDSPSSPKATKPKKKLPAGAVPVFGGANPLVGRRPPSSSDDEDDFEEPPKMESQPKSKTEKSRKADQTKKKPAESGNDPFNDEDDEDLFSTPREEKDKKPKNRAAAESLFDDIDGEGTEDDLFAATAKEPTKKKPAGGVALFGGADLFGGSPPGEKKEEKVEESESSAKKPPAENRRKANTLSIFDDLDGGDDEGDLFADEQEKQDEEDDQTDTTRGRSKSKSIFADEDVLFGLNEDDPSVDLFGSSSPTQPSKPDSPSLSKDPKTTAASAGLFGEEDEDDLFGDGSNNKSVPEKPEEESKKPKAKPKPAEKNKRTSSGGGGLFGDDGGEDDLFGGEDSAQGKPQAKEPAKHKKLPGAVSMFGGLDPTSLVKKSEPPQEPPPPLTEEDMVDGGTSPKSPLHATKPPVTSSKPSKKGAMHKPKPAKVAQKPSSPPAAASNKISALQQCQYRKPTPVRKKYDRTIRTYHPDKPLPDIPQSSFSRRNAGKFPSGGSLTRDVDDSAHSPPVPARRPMGNPSSDPDRGQYLLPPIWHYMENRADEEDIYQSIDDEYMISHDFEQYIEPIFISDKEFMSDQDILSDTGMWTQRKRRNRSRERKPVPLQRNLSPEPAEMTHPKPPLRMNNSSDTEAILQRPPPPLPRVRDNVAAPRNGRTPHSNGRTPHSNGSCAGRRRKGHKRTRLKKTYSGESDSSTSSESYQSSEFLDLSFTGGPYGHKKISRCLSPPKTLLLKPIVEIQSHSPNRPSPSVVAASAFSSSPEVPRKPRPQISSPFHPRQGVFDETYFSDGAQARSPRLRRPTRQCLTPPPRPPKPQSPSGGYRKPMQRNKQNPPPLTPRSPQGEGPGRKSPTHPRPPRPKEDLGFSPFIPPAPETVKSFQCERQRPEGQSQRRIADGNISYKDLPILPQFLNTKNELKPTYSSNSSSGYISSDCSFLRRPRVGTTAVLADKQLGSLSEKHGPVDEQLSYPSENGGLPDTQLSTSPRNVTSADKMLSYPSKSDGLPDTQLSSSPSNDGSVDKLMSYPPKSDGLSNAQLSSSPRNHELVDKPLHCPLGNDGSTDGKLGSKSSAESSLCSDIMKRSHAKRRGVKKPCRETFLLKKSLFESLSGGTEDASSGVKRNNTPANKLSELQKNVHVKDMQRLFPSSAEPPLQPPPQTSKVHVPPRVAPKPLPRRVVGMGTAHHKEGKQGRAPTSSLKSNEANLSIDPTALRPGAAPPTREEPSVEVGFDVPVTINKTLTSLQKSRPRHTVKRRPPSRKATLANQSAYDSVDGAVGGHPLPYTRSPPPFTPPSKSSPFSRSPPEWKPVKAPSSAKPPDLFGNDDLFEASDSPGAPTQSKPESDLFAGDPLLGEDRDEASRVESKSKQPPAEEDDDLFVERPAKRGEEPKSASGPSDAEDDLFRESKKDIPKKDVPSLDVDADLFATAPPPQEKGILDDDDLFDELTGAKPKKKPVKTTADSGEKGILDDEDLFGELSGAKPKKKPVKTTAVEDDDDDLFAEKPKKKGKGKKVKPDSDLFADSTDIFADLPASKPKGMKAKKEADIFKDVAGDDIFSSSGGSTPTKAKKKAKKKTKPAADSIFDSSAPSIFDDPLNATKTE